MRCVKTAFRKPLTIAFRDVDIGDALQAGPGWHAVDLEHEEPAVGVLDEVDAAEGDVDGPGCPQGELCRLGWHSPGFGAPP